MHISPGKWLADRSIMEGLTMFVVRLTALAIAVGSAAASAAGAKPPLREVSKVDDTLLQIAIANEIDKYCDGLGGRRLKAIGIMWGLRSHANALGYSDKEIRAYVDLDFERKRMRARGEAYLAQKGVTYEKPESFCRLGRAEMDRNSAIGALLRAN